MFVQPEFWKGKKVFITGHTGFKGSWLTLWLKNMGAEVTGFALPLSEDNHLFNSLGLKDDITHIENDVRDLESLQTAVQKAQPDIALHLAAQPIVRESYTSPVETIEINTMGTAHFLEAVRHTPSIQAVLVVTSDKCYENKEWVWPYRENDALGGHDPYSASKACAELLTASYRNSFFAESTPVAVASARAGNVIGGGDFSADRIVPDIIRAAQYGKNVEIRNPSSTRPWQHVMECLSGYICLAEKLCEDGEHAAQAWNFGPDPQSTKSVKDLTEVLLRHIDNVNAQYGTIKAGPHEAGLLTLDSSKAKAELNWHPSLSFEETIDWTAQWYKRVTLQGEDARNVTTQQINDFMQKVASPQTFPKEAIA